MAGGAALRVTIIDFAERGPTRDLFKRKMTPSFANVMPQAITPVCEEEVEHLDLFHETAGGEAFVEKKRRQDAIVKAAHATHHAAA